MKTTVLGFAVLIWVGAVFAETPPGTNVVQLTPAYVNQLAEEMRLKHPALLAARARTNAAGANLAAVRTWEDPRVRVGAMGAERSMRAEDGDLIYGVEQKLPLFGKPRLARNVAAAELATEMAGEDYQFQVLRRELAKALFRAALANQVVIVGEQDFAWLDTMTRSMEENYRSGTSRLTDVLQLQNERAKRAEQLKTDRNNVAHEQVALNRFLNRDFHSLWPALELPPVADAVVYNHALVNLAVRYEPKLRVMREQIKQAQAGVEVTRRQHLPEVSAGVESRNYSGNGDWRQAQLVLSVNLPWFNGGKYRSDIRRDEAKAKALEFDAADYEQSVREEIHMLTVRIDNARREALLYRDQIIPRSEQALASARTMLESGNGMLRDALEARRMLLDGRLMYARAISEQYQMLSELILCCGLGDLEALQMLNPKEPTPAYPKTETNLMKAKTFFLILVVAAVSATTTWFIVKSNAGAMTGNSNPRKVLYYQCSMDWWIKSDKPGKCTVCRMDLVPIYEGEHGFDATAGLVRLNSNSINVINVQTAEVQKRPLLRTLRVAGQIDDDDTRHRVLSAYVDGRIEKLFVNFPGAEVKEGEPLAVIYSPMLLAAQREYVSVAKQASVSETLKTEHEHMVSSAAQRLKLLGLSEKQIAALRDKSEVANQTEILAPMSGTVVARDVYVGKYVVTGEKLFELADFSTMWFKFDAYEHDLAWLAPGQSVDITAASVPGKVFTAKISFIDPNLNDPTRSAKVRVELPNPLLTTNGVARRELLHRVYAEGVVRLEAPEVLTAPRRAVLSPGQKAVVYVAKGGGAYEQRPVKLGRAGDDTWEVLDGLKAGESVVTTGNLLIDSQAQLAEGASGNGEVAAVAPQHLPQLTQPQKGAVNQLLSVASALSAALAGDNLKQFNESAATLHTAVPALSKSLAGADGWQMFAQKIETVGHFASASDLPTARKSFLPFSLATVELGRQLKTGDTNFASLKIFKCPMANQAVPGAAKDGYWLQLSGELRNPFFGSEMLDCGQEVK